MSSFHCWVARVFLSAALICCVAGCEDGGGGEDIGSNDAMTIVAMGDSITQDVVDSTTYPAILSSIIDKNVVNEARGGATSADGAARVGEVLASYKPSHLLIFYGANDVIMGDSYGGAIENLRLMIVAARNNSTIPVIATVLPMYYGHEVFDGGVRGLNAMIRDLASQENCRLVDLEGKFRGNLGYYLDDGLHPNGAGLRVIAESFSRAVD